MTSLILDAKLAAEAIELVSPSAVALLKARGTRQDFYLMVAERVGIGYASLASKDFGTRSKWQYPFNKIARKKAALSARTGLDSRIVQQTRPELLRPSDVIYWGSVIKGDIIVAGSGVQAYLDETVARMTMDIVLGLLQDGFEKAKANLADEVYCYDGS